MPYQFEFIRYERRGNRVTPVRVHKVAMEGALKTMRVTEVGWPVCTPRFEVCDCLDEIDFALTEISDETTCGELFSSVPEDWISVKDFCPASRADLIASGHLQTSWQYDGFTDAPFLTLDEAAVTRHKRDFEGYLDGFGENMDNTGFIFQASLAGEESVEADA